MKNLLEIMFSLIDISILFIAFGFFISIGFEIARQGYLNFGFDTFVSFDYCSFLFSFIHVILYELQAFHQTIVCSNIFWPEYFLLYVFCLHQIDCLRTHKSA